MSETLLCIEHLKKYFPLKSGLKKNAAFVRAVDDVTLDIHAGETLGLVGESGSGKTTLAKMILGLMEPTEGTITLDGMDIHDRGRRKELSHCVGAVFQDPASSLNPRATVYRSLERPLELNGCSKGDARDLIYETAEKVNLGRELLERFPYELSGGQQQRVSIARALAGEPSVILADEPTGALDSRTGREVLGFLKQLNREGDTVVLITHDNSIAVKADRIVRLQDGRVIYDGDAHDPRAVVQPGEEEAL